MNAAVELQQAAEPARPAGDVVVVLDDHESALAELRGLLEQLGCEVIEVTSADALRATLAARRPSLAVIGIDSAAADGLEALRLLAASAARPKTFLLGALDERVMGSARRLAAAQGLTVLGFLSRPLDPLHAERALTPHLDVPPPITHAELESALADHELVLHYQPKARFAPDGLRICGVEAFVRWQHPRRGLLYPRHFLPAMERAGLVLPLTDYVMTEAICQAGLWRRRGLALEMAINMSPRLVRDRDFPARLGALLREHDVPAEEVVLDVTEAAAGSDRALILDVFTSLRIQGIGLSLDNFGTGYSSLTELYKMPFSEVKVDGSLIAEVPEEREASIVVGAIANLAHTLGLQVCAEGVERRETLEHLRAIGFDAVQGRLLCAPAAAGEVEELVRAWRRPQALEGAAASAPAEVEAPASSVRAGRGA